MVQPSPALAARLRFTTKSVGRGFYRGNRTGSMGSHTQYGGYLIDWRKTRSYNVPDLTNFKLTPYVTREINPKQEPDAEEQDTTSGGFLESDNIDTGILPASILEIDNNQLKKDLMKHLRSWRRANPEEFAQRVEEQYHSRTLQIEHSSEKSSSS